MEWVQSLVGKEVSVLTNDGTHLVGTLRGVDKVTNLVLANTHERIYSVHAPVVVNPLGLYILRGDNCMCIGTENAEVAATVELNKIRAAPLKPLKH